ncbi:MAG: hypothetical protein BAX61_13105 [Psychrobacter sp. B29-1]|uniref:type IV secretory system conjugative DNA transfer family protein n=1 Tax=Psychrobacter sp. B29-1 TaxID=1867800 RepID=UPI00086A5C9A|nr:type IV secretory system conjugative DNA transfer family protein [Psychrobacter sp. B29-1]OEH66812.1 MAG: hypothetical protein BAX61_13105 [Psychrobacter sp. B29-1]
MNQMMFYLACVVMAIGAIGFVASWLYENFFKSYEPKSYIKYDHDMNDLTRLKNKMVYEAAGGSSPLVFYGNHSERAIKKSWYQMELPAYRVSGEERGLVVGVSGTGKTNFILAQIFDWMTSGKSLVVVDVKPEIWAVLNTNNMFEVMGYTPIVINPTDPYSDKYNFLDDIDLKNDLDEILAVVIPDSDTSVSAFNEFARRVLKAIILYLNDLNGQVSLTESYEFINSYSRTKTMFDDLKASDNKMVQRMINLALQSSDNERFVSSGMTALTSALSFLNDETISEMTRTSDFSLNEALMDDFTIIFLQFEQLAQAKTAALYATTVQHLIRLMMTNHHDRDEVFIVLDEMTNSSPIPNLPTQLNLMRAYKMPTFIYIQTVSSLYDMYGDHAMHLINSCSLKICYRTNDIETARTYSDICGTVDAQKISESYTPETRADGNTFMKKNVSANHEIMPLVPPTTLMQLPEGFVVCIYRGHAGVVEIPQQWKNTAITERASYNSPRDIFDTDECYDTNQTENETEEV